MPKRKCKRPHSKTGCENFCDNNSGIRFDNNYKKCYSFTTFDVRDLPSFEFVYKSDPWTDERFMQIKDQLNTVKEKLSDKDIVLWREHTQNVHLYSRVISHLKVKFRPELCTQAWCKFYEILCLFPLIPLESSINNVGSVHLCEAPGAFVAALNHFLVLNHPDKKLLWLATTLNPYYEGNRLGETVADDRFIYPTLSHWEFGHDNTGNIFSHANRCRLQERAKNMGPIHLVTADGSMDCQDDPGEQEKLVSRLQLTEMLVALCLLTRRGKFVIKMFTFFEHSTICLLYFLCCAFKEVHVYKPATSKWGNSEVYVICLGYIGGEHLNGYLDAFGYFIENGFTSNLSMFAKEHIPAGFLDQLLTCCNLFTSHQMNAIHSNLSCFNAIENQLELNNLKLSTARDFVTRFRISSIPDTCALVGVEVLRSTSRAILYRPLRRGSFNDRKAKEDQSWQLRLKMLDDELCSVFTDEPMDVIDIPAVEGSSVVDVVFGREIELCANSIFCLPSQLQFLNDLIVCAKEAGLMKSVTKSLESGVGLYCCDYEFQAIGDLDSSVMSALIESIMTFLPREQIQETFVANGGVTFIGSLVADYNKLEIDCSACAINFQLSKLCLAVEIAMKQNSSALLLIIDIPLTRVAVGILFLLRQSFEMVQLWSANISGIPVSLIFCKNITCNLSALSWLQSLKTACKTESNPKETFVEIIQLSLILEGGFYETVSAFNKSSLFCKCRYMLQCLNQVATY